MSPIAQIPFGPGLDKESGSMVVQPNRMLDLRNVYHHEGSLVVREGVLKTVDFYDFTSGDPATHILMGIAIRSERAGIVVSFEQTSRRVTVHKVDALGTVATAIGHWEHRPGVTAWPGSEIPKVILAEVKGTVYMAHDDQFVARRADTFVYDPTFPPGQLTVLKGLLEEPHDLSAEEVHDDSRSSPIRFRGVVRHLDYLFGWGWGNNGPEGIRPEMVRCSLPGEPRRFDPEHYFIAGDRFDPVISCAPAQKTLLVAKETETHQIVGHSRKTFGIFPYDPLYGCLGGRLMVNVSGQCYSWSAEGPMVGDDRGPWQKAWTPLDLGGFEPATLVERIAFSDGWADYIDEVELVIFCFGRRAYILSRRNPQDQRWTYWELARKAFCGFRLYGSFAASGVAGDATVDSIAVEHSSTCGPSRIKVTVTNDGQSGEEFIEAWYRIMGPRFADSPNRIPGVATQFVWQNWTQFDDTGAASFTTFPVSGLGQAVLVRTEAADVTPGDEVGVRWRDENVTAETLYRFEVSMRNLTRGVTEGVETLAETEVGIEFYDAGDVLLDSKFVPWVDHEFYRVFVELEAPVDTAYAEAVLRINHTSAFSMNVAWARPRFFEDGGPSNWLKAPIGSPGVAVSPDATQELPAFQVDEPGTTIEVAVRYVNAAGVPDATASDSDPTNWPAGSNDSILMGMEAPDILVAGVGVHDVLGPYQTIYVGCNDGGDPLALVPPRYPNRDIAIEQDASAWGEICRGNTYFRRYLGSPGTTGVALEVNDYTAKFLGPQTDSDFSEEFSLWAGPQLAVAPTIVSLVSENTDEFEVSYNKGGALNTLDELEASDGTPGFSAVEIEHDDGAGTFTSSCYSSAGEEPGPIAIPPGLGGTEITVRVREVFYPRWSNVVAFPSQPCGSIPAVRVVSPWATDKVVITS